MGEMAVVFGASVNHFSLRNVSTIYNCQYKKISNIQILYYKKGNY
jgi:hypothetical protein